MSALIDQFCQRQRPRRHLAYVAGLVLLSGMLSSCGGSQDQARNARPRLLSQTSPATGGDRPTNLGTATAPAKGPVAQQASPANATRSHSPKRTTRPRSIRPKFSLADVEDDSKIERRLFEDAQYLASDELQGRGINTRGIDLAADYISQQFAAAGLKTDLFDGTPFHPFNYGNRTVVDKQALQFHGIAKPLSLAEGDFQATRMARSGVFDLPMAFAGYGIRCPAAEYDDYTDLDVKGKAVLLLRHEPRWKDPATRIPQDRGDAPSSFALVSAKVAHAMEQGAEAVILCTDLRSIDKAPREATSSNIAITDRLMKFNPSAGDSKKIPVFHIRREIAEQLLDHAGVSLSEWERTVDETWQPRSLPLPELRVSGSLEIRRRGRQLKNVVGLLEGDGSVPNETIVVGAHYDHLGLGGAGSLAGWTREIHNGADDNASGTAAMIEVARQLAARGPHRRQVLFIGFSAEESGLIGSERYVRTPYVPMDQTIAMLNLDMVGRLRSSMEIHGTRTAKEFNALLDALAPKHGLRIEKYGDGYGPSDHSSFYERGVPVLHFFTGLHEDYHRPSDDYHALNIDGMRRIAMLTRDVSMAIAAADEAPQRNRSDTDLFGDLDLGDLSGPSVLPGRRAKLGIRTTDVEGKVQITLVYDRTAARQAGLRKGDHVLSMNGEPLRGSQQFLEQIRKASAGSTVKLVIERGRIELELDVRLGGLK